MTGGTFVQITSVPWKNYGFGKLVSIDGDIATIRYFDCPDDPHPVTVRAHVTRVKQGGKLPEQTRVYRLNGANARWQVGRVLHHEYGTVLVQFPNQEILNIPESDLETRWRRPITNPLDYLIKQVTETPRFSDARSQFMREVTRQRSACLGMNAILSSSIELTDYQYKVVKRVLQDPVQRYLLADEVGLGKTIEAGILIRQFLLDDPANAVVLVVVPPSLVDQWRSEVIRKFNLAPWLDETLHVVGSDDLDELKRLLSVAQMLVVDEAHHLSSEVNDDGDSIFGLIREHSSSVQSMLLLSATPALSNAVGFQRMLHLLDPVVFPLDDIDGFNRLIEARQMVAERVAALAPENMLVMQADLDELLGLFSNDVQLQEHITRLKGILRQLPDEDDEVFIDALEAVRIHVSETYKLHRRILRNRRSSVPWATPQRNGLRRVEYACEDARRRYEALEEFRLMLVNAGVSGRIEQTVFLHAVQSTQTPDLAEEVRSHSLEDGDFASRAAQIDALSRHARQQGRRIDALCNEVTRLLVSPNVQLVVFCDLRETAEEVHSALRNRLNDQVVRHSVRTRDEFEAFDPESEQLEKADWRRFTREPRFCRVLVCDRQAEEGLNLHGGEKIVIHFDIPASPNRIEQRMGRLDRFGSGYPIRSVAIVCADDPNEVAWIDCIDNGFELFYNSVASLQYVIDEVMKALPQKWMWEGTVALEELRNELRGPSGRVSKERRRIDQQDALDSLGSRPDDSFDELEEVDDDWKSWRAAFRSIAEDALQIGRVVEPDTNEEVFRTRYSRDAHRPTLFPLSVFIEGFLGTLDSEAPGFGYGNLLSYPYVFSRRTALTADGRRRGVRPLRVGDPLVEALRAFCEYDDRGRAFAAWRYWPNYELQDGAGCDLFFRFDFVVEANLDQDGCTEDQKDRSTEKALARRLEGCFPPQFITIWTNASGHVIDDPSAFLSDPYRPKPTGNDPGRDYNLNPHRWQTLLGHPHLPWLERWGDICKQAYGKAISHVTAMTAVSDQISTAKRVINEQLYSRVSNLSSRIARLDGEAKNQEEQELHAERLRHERMMAAVTQPRIHLDVVGAVFVSSKPFGTL